MFRRTFLALPAIPVCNRLRAQPRGLGIQWIEGNVLPEEIARGSVVFPRAYTCCPDPGSAQPALETSRFPHAIRESDEPLTRLLAEEPITIVTAGSADGGDGPEDRTTRVPLAVRWPGKLEPRVAPDILISHVDVLPTLLGLAGIPVPSSAQGRDLSARAATGRGELPDSIYCEGRLGYVDEWRMVVRGFDKIVWNLREEVTGLYNLADDPGEQTNLADKREHVLTRDSMWALARDWMRRLEDGMDPSGLRLRRRL